VSNAGIPGLAPSRTGTARTKARSLARTRIRGVDGGGGHPTRRPAPSNAKAVPKAPARTARRAASRANRPRPSLPATTAAPRTAPRAKMKAGPKAASHRSPLPAVPPAVTTAAPQSVRIAARPGPPRRSRPQAIGRRWK
jgi:hypothetical protein